MPSAYLRQADLQKYQLKRNEVLVRYRGHTEQLKNELRSLPATIILNNLSGISQKRAHFSKIRNAYLGRITYQKMTLFKF